MQNPLTRADVHSGCWKRLEAWATEEIRLLRERNDGLAVTPDETTRIRARIAQLKELLSLADQASDSGVEPLGVFDETSTSPIDAGRLAGDQ